MKETVPFLVKVHQCKSESEAVCLGQWNKRTNISTEDTNRPQCFKLKPFKSEKSLRIQSWSYEATLRCLGEAVIMNHDLLVLG